MNESTTDALSAHFANQFMLLALIRALSQRMPSLPWDISECLDNFQTGSPEQAAGLNAAQELIWKTFTDGAPTRDSDHPQLAPHPSEPK